MAIIYSYSKTNEAYGSDLLVLSRFHGGAHEDNGRNYSIEIATLAAYIGNNYASSLNAVLQTGNTSLLNAKIGELYLYDATESAYGKIRIFDSGLDIYDVTGYVSRTDRNGIAVAPSTGIAGTIIFGGITSSQSYELPDKSGTIALTSDITNTGSGLYSQISDSNMVTNTTTKTILTGTGAGTLEVAADTFNVGDSYEINLIGEITCTNSATLRITLENTEGVVFGDTGIMDLSSATGKNWFLDAIFTIRSVGGEGTANVICGGNFSYNVNSGNSSESFSFASANPNDFDTTINNTLRVFVQWGAASTSDKIVSFIFNLNKIY